MLVVTVSIKRLPAILNIFHPSDTLCARHTSDPRRISCVGTLPIWNASSSLPASRRAIAWLESSGLTTYETLPLAKDALKWAAYTYVIAAIGSLATLLYYISIGNRRS